MKNIKFTPKMTRRNLLIIFKKSIKRDNKSVVRILQIHFFFDKHWSIYLSTTIYWSISISFMLYLYICRYLYLQSHRHFHQCINRNFYLSIGKKYIIILIYLFLSICLCLSKTFSTYLRHFKPQFFIHHTEIFIRLRFHN